MTAPKTWQHKEVLTAAKMNAEVRDRLEYLKTGRVLHAPVFRPSSTARTPSFTGNEPVHVAPGDRYGGSFTASGADILFMLTTTVECTTTAGFVYFDILIDDDYYLSNGTPEHSPYFGLWMKQLYTAGYDEILSAAYLWPNPPAGFHTWKLMGWGNDASYVYNLLEASGPSFVAVMEI